MENTKHHGNKYKTIEMNKNKTFHWNLLIEQHVIQLLWIIENGRKILKVQGKQQVELRHSHKKKTRAYQQVISHIQQFTERYGLF